MIKVNLASDKGGGKGKDGKGTKDGKGGKAPRENEVFVGGLSFDCTEEVLRKDFLECGEIASLRLPMSEETGKPRGFAFISFTTKEGLEKALKFDGEEYMGRYLKVNKAGEKGNSKGKDGKGKEGKGKGDKGGKTQKENEVFVG